MALVAANTPLLLMSQSSSEGNFCLAIPAQYTWQALDALKSEFTPELESREIRRLHGERHVALLTIKGDTTETLHILAAARVTLLVTAFGAQRISFVVPESDVPCAMLALCELAGIESMRRQGKGLQVAV